MTSVETIFSLGLGLGLRGLVNAVTGPNASVSGVLVGLWEGAVLHHLTNASRSLDPYIGYALRVVVDYFWTEDSQRVIIILLWTGLGMLLADVWPALSYIVIRVVYRCYREVRRALYSLDYLLSTAFTIPSRVRHYAESSASSSASSVSVRRQPRRITSQPVPGAYTETSTISDYQESEVSAPSHFRQYEVPPGGENEILLTPLDNDSERGSTVSRVPPSHAPRHDYAYEIMSPPKSARPEIRVNDDYDDVSIAATSVALPPSTKARSAPARSARAPSTVAPSVIAPSVVAPSVAVPSVVARSVATPSVISPSIAAPPRSATSPEAAPSVATPSVVAPSSVPASSQPWKTKSVVSRVSAAQMPLPESRASSVVQASSPWQQPPSIVQTEETESRGPSPDPLDPLQTPPLPAYRMPPMRGVFSDEDPNSPPEGPPPPFDLSFGVGGDALRLSIPGAGEGGDRKSDVSKGDEKDEGEDEKDEDEDAREKEKDAAWEHVDTPAEGEEGDDTAPQTGIEPPAADGAEGGKKEDEEEEEDFGWGKKKKKNRGSKKKGGKGG